MPTVHGVAEATRSGVDGTRALRRGHCGGLYTLLDCVALQPGLHALFDGLLWVESTKDQVIQRRTGFPTESRYGDRGWPSAAEYAEHCVWPKHCDYERRVLERDAPPSASLPAEEDTQKRLQRALEIISSWRSNASATSAAPAAPANSTAASAAPAAWVVCVCVCLLCAAVCARARVRVCARARACVQPL